MYFDQGKLPNANCKPQL